MKHAPIAVFDGRRSRSVSDVTTRDTLFGGRVIVHQPSKKAGYRVNVDALLLAEFAAAGRRARRAVDLGAGVGAVGLSLLHLDAAEHVTFVEIDEALAELAVRNGADNGWADRAAVACADVGAFAARAKASFDLVVCNPPYVETGRGRPPSPATARARRGSLGAFLDAARMLVGRRARVCFVYPAIELTTLVCELRARGLEPKRIRFVHAKPQDRARIALVECAAGKPGGLAVEPPIFG